MASTVHSGTKEVGSKGLKGGALGLVSSVVVGVASTAPAYSLAASLGFIVVGGTVFAGVKAPGIVLLAFIPMYLIAVAYQELNKAEPDCGTTFTWATRAFGPVTGWMGGWGIIIADVIVMSNLAQIAGAYSFTFVGGFGLAGSRGAGEQRRCDDDCRPGVDRGDDLDLLPGHRAHGPRAVCAALASKSSS